mgnify:CR=1 FL=1
MILHSNTIFAPDSIPAGQQNSPRVFLAGSIQNGTAEEWQSKVLVSLQPPTSNWVKWLVMNPRRKQWDKDCKQNIECTDFKRQVDWELDHLIACNVAAVWFDPTTTSPITLAELGILCGIKHPHVVVYCPDGFWRKGNVEVMCQRFGFICTSKEERFIYELQRQMLAVTNQFEKSIAS